MQLMSAPQKPRSLLEHLARTRDTRNHARTKLHEAEQLFLNALVQCRPRHTLQEIGDVAGLTREGVRYHISQLNTRRQGKGKP